MEQYLIDNKVCAEGNKKCKICKLDDCRRTIEMIEDEERYIDIGYMNKLKKSLPEECRDCTIYKVINLRQQKVYCPYRLKDRCIIKEEKKK